MTPVPRYAERCSVQDRARRRVPGAPVLRADRPGFDSAGWGVPAPGRNVGRTLLRRQFPLAPAYATTFNSCQGLTLDIVGSDIPLSVCFTLTRSIFVQVQ